MILLIGKLGLTAKPVSKNDHDATHDEAVTTLASSFVFLLGTNFFVTTVLKVTTGAVDPVTSTVTVAELRLLIPVDDDATRSSRSSDTTTVVPSDLAVALNTAVLPLGSNWIGHTELRLGNN